MTLDGEQVEVVEEGRLRRMPRNRRIGWALLLVALVVIAPWWEDRDASKHYEALLTCVARAERTVKQAHASLLEASTSISTGIESGLDPADRRRLFAPIATVAAARTPALQSARRACADVRVRPWAENQQKAHDAYLRYLDAEVKALGATAMNGETAFADHSGIDQAQAEAAAALHAQANDTMRHQARVTIPESAG